MRSLQPGWHKGVKRHLDLPDLVKRFLPLLILGLLSHAPACAQDARFRADGEKLYFNSGIPYEGTDESGILDRDSDELALILMENSDITTVVLQSDGGETSAALLMAAKIENLELATEVEAGCYSACPYIFLAGRPRVLRRGGVLGFHRSSIRAKELRELYARTKSARTKSLTPGEFAYDDAVNAAVEDVRFMLHHDVAADFALTVMNTPPHAMWEPSRKELTMAGVLDAE